MLRAAICINLSAALLSSSASARVPSEAAASIFSVMKGLTGIWRIKGKPDSPLRIRFYLTAGETVLVESWERGGRPYSLTLYHRAEQT